MEFDGVVHFAFDAVSRLTRGDAAGEIGRIGGIAGRSFFNDDQVPARFNPACLRILFCVPGAKLRGASNEATLRAFRNADRFHNFRNLSRGARSSMTYRSRLIAASRIRFQS